MVFEEQSNTATKPQRVAAAEQLVILHFFHCDFSSLSAEDSSQTKGRALCATQPAALLSPSGESS